jgi:dTDP-4-amino-4,6-dideoxy-D-galactose acyltransferase
MADFKYLSWDSKFFGFKTGKINPEGLKAEELIRILKELKHKNYILAYLSLNPQNISLNDAALKNGGKLVDEKTTFTFILKNSKLSEYHSNISLYKDKNISKKLINIAIQSAEYSRFKTDTSFEKGKYRQLYTEWIIKSVKKKLADDVLVYKINNRVKGLITVGTENELNKTGFIGLVGVDLQERGKGIGVELMNAAKYYFQSKEFKIIDVVTQGRNLPACKLYLKSGFCKSKIENFYHFWL